MTWFSSPIWHAEQQCPSDDFSARLRRSQLVTFMSSDQATLDFRASRLFIIKVDEYIRLNLATVLIHYRYEHTWHQWWIYNSARIGSLSLGDGVAGETTLQITGSPRDVRPATLDDPKRIADYLSRFIAADRPDIHKL